MIFNVHCGRFSQVFHNKRFTCCRCLNLWRRDFSFKAVLSPVADGAMCYSTAFIVLAGLFMALGGHIGQYISAMTYPFAYVFSGASFQMITVRIHLTLEP